VAPERTAAFAPGRVNLIGEHTDYNGGLALPFAIAEGVTVSGVALDQADHDSERIDVLALDLGEHDSFPLAQPTPASGWRAFVRGVAAELSAEGAQLRGARLEISGDVPRGAGLSSSAAMEVALSLALLDLAGTFADGRAGALDRLALARLCSRVENEWVGAQTGMLDQLASLYGAPDQAVLIDFRSLHVEAVPLVLDGWRLAVLDSGEAHANASSGYNERRAECARACELLGLDSLRDADVQQIGRLPSPLRERALHVFEECERVRVAALALRAGDLQAIGPLLNASHRSLRDLYEISSPAVEDAVARMRAAGAAGARVVGVGFGGSVLGLFAPGIDVPDGAREVHPGPGAHLLASRDG